VHSSDSHGCHKVPPPAGKSGDVDGNGDVIDKAPELGMMLLARLRMYVVASWFPEDEDGSPAVIA
jgi:hypothetical protein